MTLRAVNLRKAAISEFPHAGLLRATSSPSHAGVEDALHS